MNLQNRTTDATQGRTLSVTKVHPDEQKIVDRIYSAVMEQRLAPRTKLSEAALCETFGVSRMRVRRALLLLGSQGIVDLQSNKGAFVACPDASEAREVFSARLIIETGIVRDLASGISKAAIETLREHIEAEDAARQRQARTDVIRLSGEFHVELARAHGNATLTRFVRQLVTRSSLIVGLFGRNQHSTCPDTEHSQIVAAIEAGDAEQAGAKIRHHLNHIQAGLELETRNNSVSDLSQILGVG